MLRATADRYRRDNSAVPYLCSADTSRLTMYSDVEYETVLLLLPTLSLRRLNRRVATTSTIFEPKWFPKEKEKRRKRKRKEIVSPHFTNKLSLACRYYYCCCCCCTFFSPVSVTRQEGCRTKEMESVMKTHGREISRPPTRKPIFFTGIGRAAGQWVVIDARKIPPLWFTLPPARSLRPVRVIISGQRVFFRLSKLSSPLSCTQTKRCPEERSDNSPAEVEGKGQKEREKKEEGREKTIGNKGERERESWKKERKKAKREREKGNDNDNDHYEEEQGNDTDPHARVHAHTRLRGSVSVSVNASGSQLARA